MTSSDGTTSVVSSFEQNQNGVKIATAKKGEEKQEPQSDSDQTTVNQRDQREITAQVDFSQGAHQLQQIPVQVVESNGTPFMIANGEVLANFEALQGQGQQLIMPHQQMIPVQINHQQLNYQYEDRDTGQPVIVSADGQQVYIDGSCQIQTRPHEPACTVASSQSGPIESDKRFVSLANVSEPSKSVPNQNNSSNVLKTEPQLQPRPQTIQPVQHQQIGQPQIITVQDEKGNSVQTQQLIYQVAPSNQVILPANQYAGYQLQAVPLQLLQNQQQQQQIIIVDSNGGTRQQLLQVQPDNREPPNKKIRHERPMESRVIKTVPQSNGESSNKNNAVFMEMAKYSADDFKACTVTKFGSTAPTASHPSTESNYGGFQEGVCAVCGDRARWQHYGVLACEGCKGFFKRSVQKNAQYVCLGNKSCPIDKKTRTHCPFCRYQKCLGVGMSKNEVTASAGRGNKGRVKMQPQEV